MRPAQKWKVCEELSLDSEKSKRSMVYYAAPAPHRYGYWSSLNREARTRFLADLGCDHLGNPIRD